MTHHEITSIDFVHSLAISVTSTITINLYLCLVLDTFFTYKFFIILA